MHSVTIHKFVNSEGSIVVNYIAQLKLDDDLMSKAAQAVTEAMKTAVANNDVPLFEVDPDSITNEGRNIYF